LKRFISYLVGRTQFTFVNNISSSTIVTSCGVPQGSVLGPLLFLIYINDISKAVVNGTIKLFADDSNMFFVAKDMKTLISSANCELKNIALWINCNKLHINFTKTNYMIFQPRKCSTKESHFSIDKVLFDNHVINLIHSTKYLGVILDDKLSWVEHIKILTSKISSVLGIMCRLKHLLPLHCKRSIYFSLVYSNLIYCIELYANVSKRILNPLSVKCNRILRILQNAPRRAPTYNLYSNFNTLPVSLLFNLFTMKLIHKCMFHSLLVPNVINRLFIQGSQVHAHNTRIKNNFIVRNDVSHDSISFYGPSLWNKLPLSLQNCSSVTSFNKQYKKYLLNTLTE